MSRIVPMPTSGNPALSIAIAGLPSSRATSPTRASWSSDGSAASDQRWASALKATASAPPPRASSAAPVVASPAPRPRAREASGAAARANRKAARGGEQVHAPPPGRVLRDDGERAGGGVGQRRVRQHAGDLEQRRERHGQGEQRPAGGHRAAPAKARALRPVSRATRTIPAARKPALSYSRSPKTL